MLMKHLRTIFTGAVLAGTVLCLALITASCGNQGQEKGARGGRAAPVEVVTVEHGPIALFRTFNGTLEARAEFMVSPKIAGRVERLAVNLADSVTRGQVVAELDNDEYIQTVAQARADLAVAKANLVEAKSAREIASREFERMKTLEKRGVASESQLDGAVADLSAKQARMEVAEAQVTRAEALLETANIRLGYTKVTADWSNGDNQRVVAERYVDEGHTVSANAPLLLIVELDPITGIIFVTEKDYARLQDGQAAELTTDAYPGESFKGHIARISPVFQQETRQARVELTIDNPGLRLKPGMFISAQVELENRNDATIVPEAALTSRDNRTGVFVVNDEEMTVSWRPVLVGIRQGDHVQIEGEGLGSRVVSLGHQLIEDGSAIIISNDKPEKTTTP